MSSFLMVFLDGIGIGKYDPEYNPFIKYGFKSFTEVFGSVPTINNPQLQKGNKYLFPADACLDIPGLPQSGTGQTSIFCGMNAAQYIGKHFGPYPYSTLVPVIKESNIFIDLIRRQKKVFFANAYPSVFFDYIKSGKSRLSVTTLSCRLNNMKFNGAAEVEEGKAITAEITNERWNKKLNYNLPVITPETGARRLLNIAGENDFTLFEYFLTDHIGHGRYEESTVSTLNTLDNFIFTLLAELPDNMDILICSDHGNVEDLSVKTHTTNPSLTITAGNNSAQLFHSIKDLTQIKHSILSIIG